MELFKRISIEGWRQFRNVDIDLDTDVCVLTGPNGCGKTTILTVLAKHFGWNLNFVSSPLFSKRSSRRIWSDFVRKTISEEEEGGRQAGFIKYGDGSECRLVVPKQDTAQYELQYDGIRPVLGLNIPSHRPINTYFPVDTIPTNPKTSQQQLEEFQQLLIATYGNSKAQNPGLILKQSLISLALFGRGNEDVVPNREFIELFEGFQKILRLILPKAIGFRKLRVVPPNIILETGTGDFLLDSMSGGIASLFGMAWQIYMYGVDKPNCTIAIDEPENHLHPSMQREFLPRLRKAFRGYKFIISTHSPFIVSSDPTASVYALVFKKRSANQLPNPRVVSQKLTHADLSSSPNQILKEILDVPTTIPVWVEKEIRAVLRKFESQKDNKEKAVQIFNELTKLGLNKSLTDFSD